MAGELVLITGANGHIGFKVVLFALEAGYRVRAVIRSQAKADKILNASSIKALHLEKDRLTFTLVPDMLAPNAYDEALKGVDYVIHVASPLSEAATNDQYQTTLIDPAVRGTTSILEAAARSSSNIKRIVITSSIVAIMDWNDFFLQDSGKTFTEKDRVPNPSGPYTNSFEAYQASKIWALNAAESWVKENKPKFSVVHVHPAFTLGKDELITEAEDAIRGTNGTILRQVLGIQGPPVLPSSTILLDDTARAHVEGLENHIPNGQSLLTIGANTWSESVKIVAKHFPKAVENGILPNNAPVETKPMKVDSSETQKLLGHGFQPFEDQVVSIVEHYLQLKGAPAA